MTTCPGCQREVLKLIRLPDADFSAVAGWPITDDLCITCVRERLGITDADLYREERELSKDSDFSIRLLKGRLGQVILESIFRNFGYEVYPYGYESYLTNVIKSLRKQDFDHTVLKIRNTPDMLVYDREINTAYLFECKTIYIQSKQFWIKRSEINTYKKSWPEAYLTCIHIQTLKVYVKKFDEIELSAKTLVPRKAGEPSNGYMFNITTELESLTSFRLVGGYELKVYSERIKKEILSKFCQ